MKRLMEILTKEMERWHEDHTRNHIALVQKYCQKIHGYDPGRFPDILARGENHDASKFVAPEQDPYVLVSWMHKCDDEGKPFACSAEDKERMYQATGHHVKTNDHHPEFYCSGNPISKEDRNKGMPMDARLMPDMAIAEMVADWCAMSEELGNIPQEWAAKVIGTRFIFSGAQQALINELLGSVWGRSVGETVRVGTSQACVLHGHPKKAGSKTDKPKGSVIKCYPFSGPGGRKGAIKKAYAMHYAISKNEGNMKKLEELVRKVDHCETTWDKDGVAKKVETGVEEVSEGVARLWGLLKEAEYAFEPGDPVTIIGNVASKGKSGIIDYSKNGFATVFDKNGKGIGSFHWSDLKLRKEPGLKEDFFDAIRPGMRVTIRTPQGQERTGRAVMKGPTGWVLNMGGAHGTPGIATSDNIVNVSGTGSFNAIQRY